METAKIVRFTSVGSADVLEIEDLPIEEPGSGEVRIKVQAIGLNRAEVMFRTGTYLEQPEFPSRIGLEAAGIVDAVGPGVTNVKIGDKVSVATGQSIGRYGTYGEQAIVPAISALPYPANLSPEEAASIWVQYLTAYFAFVDLAKVRPGQVVLITAATGGAGLGAIEIAKLLGVETIATTRSAEKVQPLFETGADHVVVADSHDLAARVMEITNGKGADLIFDPIAGQGVGELAQCVAIGGQIIVYGALDNSETPFPLGTAFQRPFTMRAYTVYSYCGLIGRGLPRDDEAFARAVAFIQENLAQGKLKPKIAETFPLAEIREAHRFMESARQVGKIVVTV